MRRAAYPLTAIALVGALFSPSLAQEGAKNLVIVPAAGPLKGKRVYANSHALLIGINRYPGMPGKNLEYALNDVRDMADILVKSYGFAPHNVRILTDSQATLGGIRAALADLSDVRGVGPEDRVLVYFSGHGQTVKLPGGGDMGFLIPHDARVDLNDFNNAGPYLGTCLPMEAIWGSLNPSPAKHVLVIADACYSGLLTNARGREAIGEHTLAQLSATRARQVMTAGGRGQVSLEMSAIGHGAFTGKLLERLKALATEDDIFTATELHSDVARAVGNLSQGKQIPLMGSYQTEGEFLFIPVAWTGPKFSAADLIAAAPKEPVIAPAPIASAPSTGKPARTRKVANLEIIQPEGWSYLSTATSACRLTPDPFKTGPAGGEYLSFEIWDHAVVDKAPFAAYFADFVEKQLARQGILDEGKAESGKTKAGLEMLGRTTYVEESGKKTYFLYAGLNQEKEMYMAKVNYSSPRVFAQYRADVELILQTATLPGAKIAEPPANNLPKRRLRDIEVTIPEGWDYEVEASGMASIFNKELAAAKDPNEFLGIVLTTDTEDWAPRHVNPEAHFRFQTDRLLNPAKIVEGNDTGYQAGKTPRGLDTLTRRSQYKYTTRQTIHWDHVGLWKDKSAAAISIRYSDPGIYKKYQKDLGLIINTLRFWQ